MLQYRAGDRIRVSEDRRLWLGATYHDETITRPTLTSPGYNPTLRSLFTAIDPLSGTRETMARQEFEAEWDPVIVWTEKPGR